jgi:hypothetical protein
MGFHQSCGADNGIRRFETVPRKGHIGTVSYVVCRLSPTFSDPARLINTHDLVAAEEHWLCHGILLNELNVARAERDSLTTGRDRTSEGLSVRSGDCTVPL